MSEDLVPVLIDTARHFADRQIFRYARPGWRRVACSEQTSVPVRQFASEAGDRRVVAVNLSPEEKTVSFEAESPPGAAVPLALVVTSAQLNCTTRYQSAFSRPRVARSTGAFSPSRQRRTADGAVTDHGTP
jgi:hypothetical protein